MIRGIKVCFSSHFLTNETPLLSSSVPFPDHAAMSSPVVMNCHSFSLAMTSTLTFDAAPEPTRDVSIQVPMPICPFCPDEVRADVDAVDETVSIGGRLSGLPFLQDGHRKDGLAEELVVSRDEIEKPFNLGVGSLPRLEKIGVIVEDQVGIFKNVFGVVPHRSCLPKGRVQFVRVVREHSGHVVFEGNGSIDGRTKEEMREGTMCQAHLYSLEEKHLVGAQ